MDIEEVRQFALGLRCVKEEWLTGETWASFSVKNKWFMTLEPDAHEPRVSVLLPPKMGAALREKHEGVRPACNMNKQHWNDLDLKLLDERVVRKCIEDSYQLLVSWLSMSKREREKYDIEPWTSNTYIWMKNIFRECI